MRTHLPETLDYITLISHSINRNLFDSNELDSFYSNLNMHEKNVGFCYILLFYFRVTQACAKLRKVYGDGALTIYQCQKWFAKFRSGYFDVNYVPRSVGG